MRVLRLQLTSFVIIANYGASYITSFLVKAVQEENINDKISGQLKYDRVSIKTQKKGFVPIIYSLSSYHKHKLSVISMSL